MTEPLTGGSLPASQGDDVAVVYAGDYVNKLSGQRIERECLQRLECGCRALVIDFRDTELVNSIGVSILLGIIDLAEKNATPVIFADVNSQTGELFDMLGLTRYAFIAKDQHHALLSVSSSYKCTTSH